MIVYRLPQRCNLASAVPRQPDSNSFSQTRFRILTSIDISLMKTCFPDNDTCCRQNAPSSSKSYRLNSFNCLNSIAGVRYLLWTTRLNDDIDVLKSNPTQQRLRLGNSSIVCQSKSIPNGIFPTRKPRTNSSKFSNCSSQSRSVSQPTSSNPTVLDLCSKPT